MAGLTNPVGLWAAGSLLSAPQQYVAQRAQWFRANVTGGSTMASLFAVSPGYCAQKLAMLACPFLKRWSYVRQHEPVAGGGVGVGVGVGGAAGVAGASRWSPPCSDVNAPDLYLPLLAAWTYALLVAGVAALSAAGGRRAIFGNGGSAAAGLAAAATAAAVPAAAAAVDPAAAAAVPVPPPPPPVLLPPPAPLPAGPPFKPDVFSGAVYSAAVAWAVHWAAARLLLRGMGAAGGAVPWSELAAYTGYAFAPVCFAVVAGILGGAPAYYAAWAYGSACMAAFMVRTMKRVLFQEARTARGGGGGGVGGMSPGYGGSGYGGAGGYGGGVGGGYGAPPPDLKSANYLLLALALFQFPWAWWLGVRA
jgi:hypothetical protein